MASHGVARTTRTRTEEQRRQDVDKIARYRELEDQVRAKAAQRSYDEDAFALTTRLLRANPEYYTIWNVRRRCLLSGLFSASSVEQTPTTEQSASTPQESQRDDLEIIKSELMFTIPLLMEFPKCYWLWSHRLWTLKQAIARLDAPVARGIWTEELGLVSKMLSRDRRNFHAWGYRRKVVAQLEDAALGGTSMVEDEFRYTTAKINEDLSNFSAWHNRSQLIPRLLRERGADEAARKKLLDEELELIRNALNVGPDDQSLWYYHQFLIHNLIQRDEQRTMVPHFSTAQRAEYVVREIEDIKEFLEDYDDVKWIYEALLEYTLAKAKIENRDLTSDEKAELGTWLAKLRRLDPMRDGRWTDVARRLDM